MWWIGGRKFELKARKLFEDKGAERISWSNMHFTVYKLGNLEITVPFTQVNTFSVFIKTAEDTKITDEMEAYTADNGEYNFHHPRNCSIDFAIEKLKKHIEPLNL